MGFFRRSRSAVRGNEGGEAVNSASAWRAPPVGRPIIEPPRPVAYPTKYPASPQLAQADSDHSLGETLASADQFELEIPMKSKIPVGILRNSSARSADFSFSKRRCLPKLTDAKPRYAVASRVSSKSTRDNDTKSTASSITIDSYCSQQHSQHASTRPAKKGKGTAIPTSPPKFPKSKAQECRDYSSCCGYTTATGDTDDSNSLADVASNQKGSGVIQTRSAWTLCATRGASHFAAHSEDDLLSVTMFMAARPVRRERSLFDNLQDEPDEEVEEEEEDGETDTHLSVAERSRIATEAETVTVATAASKKEKKLSLPKELVRGLSLVTARSIQSLRKLKRNKKVKEKSSKLQQYSVDQYSHYRVS